MLSGQYNVVPMFMLVQRNHERLNCAHLYILVTSFLATSTKTAKPAAAVSTTTLAASS